jgi:hypothetical protein
MPLFGLVKSRPVFSSSPSIVHPRTRPYPNSDLRETNQTNVITWRTDPGFPVHAETCAPVIRDGYSNPKAAVFSPQRCQPLVTRIAQAFLKAMRPTGEASNPYPAMS